MVGGMAVETTAVRTVLNGNGSATAFPFSFHVDDPTTVSVIYTDAAGNSTTLPASAYSVALNSGTDGGTVTYSPGIGPIPTGSTLTIVRTVPLTQDVALNNQDGFYPEVVTGALDQLTMGVQQVDDAVKRAFQAPSTDPLGLNYLMPTVAQRAGLFAGWDSLGNLVAVKGSDPNPDISDRWVVPTGGTASRQLSSILGDQPSAAAYGVLPNGTDQTAAINAMFAALPDGAQIIWPRGNYIATVGSLTTGGKLFRHLVEGGATLNGSPVWDMPGLAEVAIGKGRCVERRRGAGGTDGPDSYHLRVADYTGGTPGYVNSALRVDAEVSAGTTSFEWALVGVLNNHANAGENVGVYGQGNKHANGATWAMVAEACDLTNASTTPASTGLVGIEVDNWCNGDDTNQRRIGVDVVVGNAQELRGLGTGAKGISYAGVRVGSHMGNHASGDFRNGIVVNSAIDNGLLIDVPNGTRGVSVLGNLSVGVDTSFATLSAAALRMALGQYVSFDTNDLARLYAAGGALQYVKSGIQMFAVTDAGELNLNQTRVLRSRRPGWADYTGTQLRNAPVPGTTTLSDLCAIVGTLIRDLHATNGHGLIGA
jgi:hypothetical protein